MSKSSERKIGIHDAIAFNQNRKDSKLFWLFYSDLDADELSQAALKNITYWTAAEHTDESPDVSNHEA